MAKTRSEALRGNKNAAKGRSKSKFGSANEAIKAFGPRPAGGIFGLSAQRTAYDLRVDNYLGHSTNKGSKGLYKIATPQSIKRGGW